MKNQTEANELDPSDDPAVVTLRSVRGHARSVRERILARDWIIRAARAEGISLSEIAHAAD